MQKLHLMQNAALLSFRQIRQDFGDSTTVGGKNSFLSATQEEIGLMDSWWQAEVSPIYR
jgi:hypothetical protein